MTLSLVIVTCFAMSFTAVGCDCASCSRRFSLALHAGCATHAFELCCTVFLLDAEFRLLFPFCLLLSSVFLLNVASSSERLLFFPAMHRLSAECGRLCSPGFVPRCRRVLPRSGGAFLPSYPNFVLQALRAPFLRLPCPCCVELLTLSYHILSQARRLEICNIEPGDCAAVCSGGGHRFVLDLAAGHHRGFLCFSRHMWSRCSFLRDLDRFLKLRHVGEFPGCPHFIWDISLKELEKRISAAFLTIITRSLCN